MFSNYFSSLAAALVLSAAGAACATADSTSRTDANAAIYAGESGNPASVDYASRPVVPASNEEIDAAETDNPYIVDYRNRMGPGHDANANAEWESLEAGNPNAAQPGRTPETSGSGSSAVAQ